MPFLVSSLLRRKHINKTCKSKGTHFHQAWKILGSFTVQPLHLRIHNPVCAYLQQRKLGQYCGFSGNVVNDDNFQLIRKCVFLVIFSFQVSLDSQVILLKFHRSSRVKENKQKLVICKHSRMSVHLGGDICYVIQLSFFYLLHTHAFSLQPNGHP